MVPGPDNLRFERYLRDSFAGLVARLRARYSERVAVEDLVQEALLRAWQLEARGEEIRSLEPWMAATAANLARSRWRTIDAEDRAVQKVAADPTNDSWNFLQETWASSSSHALALAMGELSKRQRQVVALHYYGDLSVHETARRLDVSQGTVKRTLHDARAVLRRLLAPDQTALQQRRQTMNGWFMAGSHPKQYEHELVADSMHEGKPVVRMRCSAAEAEGFGTLMQTFSAGHFLEQRVRLSAGISCAGVEGWSGLWMRVDGPSGAMLAFDNMGNRPIRGTMGWQRYHVVLDVRADAAAIALGVLLNGRGEVWMSDFRVETVGHEVDTTDSPLPDRPQNLDFSEGLAEE